MPGLLPPRPAAADASAAQPKAGGDTAADPAAAEAAAPAGASTDVTPDAEAAPEAGSPAGPAEGADAAGAGDATGVVGSLGVGVGEEEQEDEDEDRGEPLFEVSDRRATILADRVGIVFRLDEEEADFTWDEIGAVEIDTPRFGRRFKVTVYTGPRRWFEAHVEAPSRGLLKTWTAELDAVLDEHFEDPEAEKDADEPADAGAADAGTTAEPDAEDTTTAEDTTAAPDAPESTPAEGAAEPADGAGPEDAPQPSKA